MRFCMVSTFYPPYHFGGDAVYVQRLANALARRGHAVDVIHDVDAYYASGGGAPAPAPTEHPGITVHRLKSRFGILSPLATHQTAAPWFKPALRQRLTSGDYDVIHFHNPSLIGSASFRYGTDDAVKLYTLHEHWLICPTHVLWKFGREACDEPQCLSCCIRAGRPPQMWRYTGRLARDLAFIDRFLSPSEFTRMRHEQAGLELPVTVLPHFVPAPRAAQTTRPQSRGYFLFVGRLIKLKGVESLLRAFRRYTAADLLIAGAGEERAALEQQARDLPHVKFLGQQNPEQLDALYRHAIALVMPSIGYEVFGLVLLEALAVGTPVIARDLGGMPEVVNASHGGFTFRTEDDLVAALQTLQDSPERRRALGEAGRQAYAEKWSEDAHLDAYLEIVASEMEKKGARPHV